MKPNRKLTGSLLVVTVLAVGFWLLAVIRASDYQAPVAEPVTQAAVMERLAGGDEIATPSPAHSPSPNPGAQNPALPNSGPVEVFGLFVAGVFIGYLYRLRAYYNRRS